MKRKVGWIVFGIFAVGIVLGAVLYVGISAREKAIAGREPLSMEELDWLAERLGVLIVDEGRQTAQPEGVNDPETLEDMVAAPAIPTRLERVPSPEMLAEKFASEKLTRSEDVKRRIARELEVMKAFEAAVSTFGPKRSAANFTWQVGSILMKAGKWDDARRYFYQALEESTKPVFTRVCSQLAWLEDDPEKAVRLLELSIDEKKLSSKIRNRRREGNDAGADMWAGLLQERLSNALELAEATGSHALASHYRERLRMNGLEPAQHYDTDTGREK